jgi:hypothetical protein
MAKQTKKDFTALSKPSLADKLERTEKNKTIDETFFGIPQAPAKNKGGRPQVKKGGKRSNFLFSPHIIKLISKGWHFEEFASQTAFIEHVIDQYCQDKPYYTPDQEAGSHR